MAADPWDAFNGIPASAGPATPTAPSATAADPWSAFNGTPAPMQPTPAALMPAAQTAASAAAAPATPQPASTSATVGRGLALGARDVLEGIAGPVYDAAAYLPRKAGLPIRSFSANLDALGLPHSETDSEQLASSIVQPVAGTLLGQGMGRAMMGAASPALQAAGEALTVAPGAQAASAGVGGAVQEETGSPMAGFAASLATPLAMGAVSRTISPDILAGIDPARAAALNTARQEGIPLSLAQQTGGKVARNFESTLANLPGSSGIQAAQNDAQSTAYNAAIMRRAGVPGATDALPDTLNAARANIGQTFNDLTARNTLTPDPQFLTELQGHAANVARYIPESDRGPINARIDDIVSGLQTGTMPGRTYQNLDSSLGQDIRSTTDGKTRMYLGQVRDSLRDAMDRSITPADQGAWQDARRQYANLMTVAKAQNRPSEGSALGNISPAALAQASNNPNLKSFAFGRGNLDDLSRLGQVALKQTVPDSGTAQRTVMANMLQGNMLGAMGAAGAGALAGGQNPLYALAVPAVSVGMPNLAARAYHSDWLQNYLTNNVAAGLRPAPNALTPVVANSGAQMLRDR